MTLEAFHRKTKASGFYHLDLATGGTTDADGAGDESAPTRRSSSTQPEGAVERSRWVSHSAMP
jgi:hypothetical protein